MGQSRVVVVSLLVLLLGCGRAGDHPHSNFKTSSAITKKVAAAQPPQPDRPLDVSLPNLPTNPARKIIYNAGLEVVVENLKTAEQAVTKLVNDHGGYLAKSQVRAPASSLESRFGSWTLRIPVERFTPCLNAISELGELKHSSVDSSDVTDQFYDLQAHIKNNQVEEESLQKFLIQKSTQGTLDEILTIRKEIRAIRGEIERQQGQLQRWSNDTSFATVILSIYEQQIPVVATAPGMPTFIQQIYRTFSESLNAMLSVCRGLILFLVAILPWIPLFLVVLLIVWLTMTHRRAAIPPAAQRSQG